MIPLSGGMNSTLSRPFVDMIVLLIFIQWPRAKIAAAVSLWAEPRGSATWLISTVAW